MTEIVTADAPVQPTDVLKIVTPWLTLQQAAQYAKRSEKPVRLACVEFQRYGNRGLRCEQPGGPGGHYLIHVNDLDRWIQRLPPSRGVHKAVG